jgi:hypothetical protein
LCVNKEEVVKKITFITIVCAVFIFAACENSTNTAKDNEPTVDEEEVTDEQPDETVDETVDEVVDENEVPDEFDPSNPGYTVEFFFADMNMMGTPTAIIGGYVMKTAREDLDEEYEGPTYMIDTCVLGEEPPREPECQSKDDCAPEQECVPDYDDSGNPKPGTEHCATPGRESLDVGPIKIKGFASGEQTFLYEPNDQIYKLNGEGDGSVDSSLITYNQKYELYAEDPTPEDLTPFNGEFFLGNKLELTSHTVVSDGGGMPFIELDMTQPLTFKWTGNEGEGYLEMTITAMLNFETTVSVSCTVADDGEFTIPAEYASQLQFGTGMMAQMGSIFSITRKSKSPFSGDTISYGKFGSDQILFTNVRPKQ